MDLEIWLPKRLVARSLAMNWARFPLILHMNIYRLALLACFNNEAYSASYLHIISLSLFMSKIHVTEISLRIWRLLAEREKKTNNSACKRSCANQLNLCNQQQPVGDKERREEIALRVGGRQPIRATLWLANIILYLDSTWCIWPVIYMMVGEHTKVQIKACFFSSIQNDNAMIIKVVAWTRRRS